MAERKAVNKYYPPDWDPRKGSVNKRVGQHPLRDRARKLSQGILVIRFELPYNIWCGGCGSHVGMGVRYNAEKSKVGNYYSTPIYKFRMKCHLCDNYFEIQTDPKNHDYVILSGARRKEQRWDPMENGQVVPEDKATHKKLVTDAMYKLEHGSDDHQKGKEKVMSLAQIEDNRMSMKDDYILNRMARDKFRSEKKQLKEAAEADRAILEKAALDIPLVEETEEDRKLAGLMKFSVTTSFEEKQKERRKSIEQRPIFNTGESSLPLSTLSSPSSSSSSSSSCGALPHQRHAPVSLNRRGELKQKLGRALQATYKDPFKTVRKKNGAGIFSSQSQNPSQLGIRLKSSDSNKMALSSSSGVKRKGDKNMRLGSPHSVVPVSQTDVQEKKVECGEFVCTTTSDRDNGVSANSGTESSTALVSESGDSSTNKSLTSHENGKQPANMSSPLINFSAAENHGCDGDKANAIQTGESGAGDIMRQNLSSSQSCSAPSSQVNSDPSSELSVNNTGLQTLICSYTDSDSESSS